ncbi:hypothetical protein JCM3765_006997 [Sporobolomyces pararoseus]
MSTSSSSPCSVVDVVDPHHSSRTPSPAWNPDKESSKSKSNNDKHSLDEQIAQELFEEWDHQESVRGRSAVEKEEEQEKEEDSDQSENKEESDQSSSEEDGDEGEERESRQPSKMMSKGAERKERERQQSFSKELEVFKKCVGVVVNEMRDDIYKEVEKVKETQEIQAKEIEAVQETVEGLKRKIENLEAQQGRKRFKISFDVHWLGVSVSFGKEEGGGG